jgi:hypothetical protein
MTGVGWPIASQSHQPEIEALVEEEGQLRLVLNITRRNLSV